MTSKNRVQPNGLRIEYRTRAGTLLTWDITSMKCDLSALEDFIREAESEVPHSVHQDWCSTQRVIPFGAVAERGPCNCDNGKRT